MLRRHLLSAAVTVALCAAGGAAFAAAAQNNAAPRQLQNGPAQPAPPDIRDARLEGRLAYLKTELRITPAQTGAWDAYANALRNEARDRVAQRENPPLGPRARPSLVDGLAERQQRLAAESARLDHMLAALKPLYAVLSDDQRRMADRLLAPNDAPPARFGMRMPPRFAWDRRFDRGYYR